MARASTLGFDVGDALFNVFCFLDGLLGPVVVVHVDEFVVAGLEAGELVVFLPGGSRGNGVDAPEGGEVVPRYLDAGLGPFPVLG